MPRPDIDAIARYAAQVVACNKVPHLPMPDLEMKRRATLLTLAKQDVPTLLAYIAVLEAAARWRDARTEPPPTDTVSSDRVLAYGVSTSAPNMLPRVWLAYFCKSVDMDYWAAPDGDTLHITHWRPLPEPPEAQE